MGPMQRIARLDFGFDLPNATRGIESEILRRIASTDDGERMPPPGSGKAKLTPREIELIRKWIAQGAPWQPFWSFIPPQRPALPATKNGTWAKNPIDRFILARLERECLHPSPEADKRILIRRVSLDLTGLPPTPAEVDAFLADQSPRAYETVVDRLLASPRYGERMAYRWMEAARYGDSNGYQTDGTRDMWRWRDWVIDAFNRNMPYDRFTVEQLAGDLLPNATLDQKIASGFNRNHRTTGEGGIIPEEYRVEYVADRAQTTATVWMGLTVGCARCHDHKYDPISQKDFYRLFAFFNQIPNERGFVWNYGPEAAVCEGPSAGAAEASRGTGRPTGSPRAKNLPESRPCAGANGNPRRTGPSSKAWFSRRKPRAAITETRPSSAICSPSRSPPGSNPPPRTEPS